MVRSDYVLCLIHTLQCRTIEYTCKTLKFVFYKHVHFMTQNNVNFLNHKIKYPLAMFVCLCIRCCMPITDK